MGEGHRDFTKCFLWVVFKRTRASQVPRGNLPASVGDVNLIPGSQRLPGEGNGTHSSVLGWGIPWTEGPGGLWTMGSQTVEQGLVTKPPPPFNFLKSNSHYGISTVGSGK